MCGRDLLVSWLPADKFFADPLHTIRLFPHHCHQILFRERGGLSPCSTHLSNLNVGLLVVSLYFMHANLKFAFYGKALKFFTFQNGNWNEFVQTGSLYSFILAQCKMYRICRWFDWKFFEDFLFRDFPLIVLMFTSSLPMGFEAWLSPTQPDRNVPVPVH